MGMTAALMGGQTLLGGLQAFGKQDEQNAVDSAQKTVGQANIDAQNLLAQVQTDARNKVAGANNVLSAAVASLANFSQSASNYWKTFNGGQQINANVTNLLRIQDRQARGSLESRLRSAEQLGALTASAAARGVGGASASMLHSALALTSARSATRTADQYKQVSYDMLMQRSSLASGMVLSLNQGQTFAPMDFTQSVAPRVIAPIWRADFDQSPMSAFLSSTASSLLGNAAKAFINSPTSGGGAFSGLGGNLNKPATFANVSYDSGVTFGVGGTSTGYGAAPGLSGIGTF